MLPEWPSNSHICPVLWSAESAVLIFTRNDCIFSLSIICSQANIFENGANSNLLFVTERHRSKLVALSLNSKT